MEHTSKHQMQLCAKHKYVKIKRFIAHRYTVLFSKPDQCQKNSTRHKYVAFTEYQNLE